ncbi:hypothetical protein R6Q57_019585 [Mikania cordata]
MLNKIASSKEKMADLRFAPDHNMTAYLGYPAERHPEFRAYGAWLQSELTPMVLSAYWGSFIVKPEDPVELDQGLVNRTIYHMGHEGAYPPTEKKLLHPYWRYLAHIGTQCVSGRKGGYDVLNQTLSSCLVALALGMDFNYSKMIFQDMHANIKGKRKERFLEFPRFLQIIINKLHPTLVPTIGTL